MTSDAVTRGDAVAVDAATRRHAETAHYRLQSLLYLRRRRDVGLAAGGRATFFATDDDVAEPEWNHAALIAAGDDEVDELIDRAREHYAALGRPATVAVTPATRPAGLGDRLAAAGFAPSFRHAWLLHRGEPAPAALPPGVEIVAVDGAGAMASFVEVFAAVYSRDLESGAAEPLAPAYARLLWRSFREPAGDAGRVVHYLARERGQPAGIATTLVGDGAAGLYDLAVLPSHRDQGIGAALTAHRLAGARARGARLFFLQTERPQVERWQRRHGFVPGFVTVGWTAR